MLYTRGTRTCYSPATMFLVGLLCLSSLTSAYKTPPPPITPQTPTAPFFSIEGLQYVPRCGYDSCHVNTCGKDRPKGPLAASRMPCFCDSSCVLFGDCCFDYYEVCLNTSMSHAEGETLNASKLELSWLKQSRLLKYRTCMEQADDFYWLISQCPLEPNSEYAEDCEQRNRTVWGRVPVTLKENPVITFANIYCAMCHGINRHEVRFWKTKAICIGISNTSGMSFQSISRYVMTKTCRLNTTENQDDKPRACVPVPSILTKPMINSSNKQSESPSHQLCLMYSYPVRDFKSFIYRNPHCAVNISDIFSETLLCPWMIGSASTSTAFPSRETTQYLTHSPYPTDSAPHSNGYTPWQATTPYPGPTRYPIGFIPSPGATPYIGLTPYPIGLIPWPGATPYPGPSRYPIGFTPWLGATPYIGPTPYPIGFTPVPGATPYPGPSNNQPSGNNKGPDVVSLDILFNFGENEMSFQVGEQTFTDVTYCPQDEVYVTYSSKCEKLICHDKDTRPVNGSCVLLDKLVMNGTQQIYPQGSAIFTTEIHVSGKKQRTTERRITYLFWKMLRTTLLNISSGDFNIDLQSLNKNCKSDVHVSDYVFCNETNNEFLLPEHQVNNTHYGSLFCEYRLIFETNIPSTDFINITIDLYNVFTAKMKRSKMKVLIFTVSNLLLETPKQIQSYVESLARNKSCPVDRNPELHLGTDLVVADKIYYAKLGREYFNLDNIIFQIPLYNGTTFSKLADIIVCTATENNETLHCPNGMVPISASTFKLGPDNDTLILTNGDGILQSDNFTLTDDGALVCNKFTSVIPTVQFFDYNRVQVILTMLSSSVSICSLFLLLIVYFSLPELRNIPGKIVMCLSFTLLLAQVFQLLIKVPTGWMCVVVASLSHVTWLSTFMWTTILSIDLARSLRSMAPIPGNRNHKLFCLYSVVAWVLPCSFVTACVLVDHFNVLGIVIGYGSEGLCWIGNPMASLYVFGLPVILSLAVNVFCFTLTVFGIEHTARLMMNPSKCCKNEKTRLAIYIRLTFIMGFTWISCFAAAFVRMALIWYFQIVLNGLQGFYIFLCFVCKPRIMRLLAEKYNLKLFKKRAKDNPSMTLTTST